MDYKRIYDMFIADRLLNPTTESYTEVHHILPRSLGGDNTEVNLIRLSGKDHLFAHILLSKIYGNGMWWALKMMLSFNRYKGKCRRTHYQKAKSNLRLSESTKLKMSESAKGRIMSKVTREKLRQISLKQDKTHLIGNIHSKGFKHTLETRTKISNGKKGNKFTEAHKLALSIAHSRKKVVIQYDKDLNFVNEFNSLKEAAFSIGSNPDNLGKKVNSTKTFKNFFWKFK